MFVLFMKIWFVFKTLLIIGYEWLKYCYTNNYNSFIINITHKLSNENLFYGKMFQAISTSNHFIHSELSDYLLTFTDKVKFDENDIDNETIHDLYRYNQLNGYQMSNLNILCPINSGLISLVYLVNLNGKDVIIKIKRKHIEYTLNDAFDKISFFIQLTKYIKQINKLHLHKIFDENKKIIMEQLDFFNEVNNIQLFNKKFKNVNYITIPNVYAEYTNHNQNIIVMDYIKGKTINQLSLSDKEIYSRLFSKFGMKCILFDGLYHADMHPGNLLFLYEDKTYKLGIIDFGLIGKLTREEQNMFYMFMTQLLSNKYDECARTIIELMTEVDINNTNNTNNLNKSEKNTKHCIIQDLMANDCLINDIKVILKNLIDVHKTIRLEDIIQMNKILNSYNIQLSSFFYNIQLAISVSESINKSLCINKTFIDCLQEEAKHFILDYM